MLLSGEPPCLITLQVVGQKQDEVSPVIHVRLREQEPDAAASMALLQQVGLEDPQLCCASGGLLSCSWCMRCRGHGTPKQDSLKF